MISIGQEYKERYEAGERELTALRRERDFLLAQLREMAQAQPYAMVDYVRGPHQRTPDLDTYNEEIETQQALSAWNGEGDRQSFIDGYKSRAKRERVFK